MEFYVGVVSLMFCQNCPCKLNKYNVVDGKEWKNEWIGEHILSIQLNMWTGAHVFDTKLYFNVANMLANKIVIIF